MGLLYIK